MATRQGLDTSIVNRLGADEQAIFIAVKAEFDSGTIRLWSGLGDASIDSETYTGAGDLLSISNVEENLTPKILTLHNAPYEIKADRFCQ